MAVTAKLYGNFLKAALNKEIDFDSDDIYIMLCTSAYVPDQDTHGYKNQVTNEVTGAGYVAGGLLLSNKAITYTAGTNVLMLDADNFVWPNSTITARIGVLYDRTPATDAVRPLIGYIDFGQDIISTGGNFTITPDNAGIATITV